jgi:hypothetical protein
MRSVLLLLVIFSCLVSSLLIDYCQCLSNGLSDCLAMNKIKTTFVLLLLYEIIWLGERLRPCLLLIGLILSKENNKT